MAKEFTARIGRTRALGTASLFALVLGVVAMPDASRAFGYTAETTPPPVSFLAKGGTFTPASVDPRVAALIARQRADGREPMRFTPAMQPGRESKSVTVAVRVDSAKLVTVRNTIAQPSSEPGKSSVRVAPVRYDLGLSRGYAAFAQPAPKLPALRQIDLPDLADFAAVTAKPTKPGRFDARIALEDKERGRPAPRTLGDAGEQAVDLAGSYRVTRNIDLTAGVRYSQERDRLQRIDQAQDNQAVYVGTRFRF